MTSDITRVCVGGGGLVGLAGPNLEIDSGKGGGGQSNGGSGVGAHERRICRARGWSPPPLCASMPMWHSFSFSYVGERVKIIRSTWARAAADAVWAAHTASEKNHPKHMHALHLRVRERGDASADKGKTGRESKVFTTASGWSSLPHGTTEPHEVH